MTNDNTKIPSDLQSAQFTISEVTGIGKGDDFVRLDASSILKIGDRYHVWYTRHPYNRAWMVPWGSGNFTKICLATSKDGWNWEEHGQVLEDSPDGRHFEKAADFDAAISDPGAFSADKFQNVSFSKGANWGLSQLYEEKKTIGDKSQNIVGASAYIVRWDLGK